MKLPWVSRKLLESAEERAQRAEEGLRLAEAHADRAADHADRALARASAAETQAAAADARAAAAETRLAAVEAERKLLTDRAFQMMGQPPVFDRTDLRLPTSGAEAQAESLPGPKVKTSFDDVHEAFRRADREGKLNLVKGA